MTAHHARTFRFQGKQWQGPLRLCQSRRPLLADPGHWICELQ